MHNYKVLRVYVFIARSSYEVAMLASFERSGLEK